MSGRWPAKLPGRLACAALVLVGLIGGCLPETGPGIGQRVLPGRGLASLAAGVGEHRPLFFSMPSQPGQRALDLYLLRPGQPAPELLVSDAVEPPTFDARGRVYVRHTPARTGQGDVFVYQLRQIDLAAGAPRELGIISRLSPSPGATHLVLVRPDRRRDSLTLAGELRPLPVGPSGAMRFVGEDVCWVDQRRLDCALAEGGPPVHPTDLPVSRVLPLPSGSGRPHLLVITVDPSTRPPVEFLQFWRVRLRPGPGEPAELLLGRGRPLGEVIVSADAAWFAFVDLPGSGVPRLRLINAATPSEVSMDLQPGTADFEDERIASFGWSDPRFRPGRNEIWSLGPGGTLAILRADGSQDLHRPVGPARRAPDVLEWVGDRLTFYPTMFEADQPRVRNMFSADGRWWVYREGDRIHLADADDPAAPSRLQLPPADDRGVIDIQGRNRLGLWRSVGSRRVQLHLHAADSLAPLATVDEVRQVVVGRRGVLALTGFQGRDRDLLMPGTLSLAALDGGQPSMVIGHNVTQFVLLSGCPTCDPVAAGTRLAYTVHARVPWKYDGLWMGELP